jgi:transcription elongation GreA/GreB family factor
MASDEDTTVHQGSRVRYRDGDGQERVVLLRDDDDPAMWVRDGVSTNTPLARAILGHRAGEEVEVVLHPPLPVRKVRILAVEDGRAGESGS